MKKTHDKYVKNQVIRGVLSPNPKRMNRVKKICLIKDKHWVENCACMFAMLSN